jgi:hypothetical protein
VAQQECIICKLIQSTCLEAWIFLFGPLQSGETFLNLGGLLLAGKFKVNINVATWQAYRATWNLFSKSAFSLGLRKIAKNLDRFDQPQVFSRYVLNSSH